MVAKKNDGKTRQRRYWERNREKINAANARRNRERRMRRKLNSQPSAQSQPQESFQPTVVESDTSSHSPSNILTTIEKCAPDPTLLEDVATYKGRFKNYQEEVGLAIDEYQKGSDFARGWTSKVSFIANGLSKKILKLEKEGLSMIREGSVLLKRLSYRIDTHLQEWEETSTAYMHTGGYLRVMNYIDDTYRIAVSRQKVKAQAKRKAREELPKASE
ncbi:hypothetical protein CVT26_005985 [Gymnopilus dilepis]|uniref:BZIP domain-containing protein n=1 Tax=Gymnopilus dilepis TaxID=231916 RepID=A0A409WYU5_9AGAR|nr:hypothetical protein CVT26_005985 [Gymnopilus dilepis]